MQQKFAYSFNGTVHWLRGLLLPFQSMRPPVNPSQTPDTNFVWRNQYADSYKIGEAYRSLPMDLSNYLFIRTREHILFENKVHAPAAVLKSNKAGPVSANYSEGSLKAVKKELAEQLPLLSNMLYVLQPLEHKSVPDLPVAFATNALYVLERNN